jgi:flagellar hook-associated protein 1 FlgK
MPPRPRFAQAGVDLDTEAINLTRFQQAFQASGRVMQVASNLFDTILAIK